MPKQERGNLEDARRSIKNRREWRRKRVMEFCKFFGRWVCVEVTDPDEDMVRLRGVGGKKDVDRIQEKFSALEAGSMFESIFVPFPSASA
ncbi:MAG: hypothetical protein Q7S16_04330 [bacterium]|nr:hypothetical protein [bacterium]